MAVWSAETRDRDGRPVRDPDSATYGAAIEIAAGRDIDPDPAPFARRVRREAAQRGFQDAPRRVVLGDGAHVDMEARRRASPRHHPGRRHLARQGASVRGRQAIYGAGTDLADRWGKTRHDTTNSIKGASAVRCVNCYDADTQGFA